MRLFFIEDGEVVARHGKHSFMIPLGLNPALQLLDYILQVADEDHQVCGTNPSTATLDLVDGNLILDTDVQSNSATVSWLVLIGRR